MGVLGWWRRPARIEQALSTLNHGMVDMGLNIEKLKASVEKITSVTESAIQTLKSVAEDVRAAGVNQTDLDQIANALEKRADEIAAAMVANTPAANEGSKEPADAGNDVVGKLVDIQRDGGKVVLSGGQKPADQARDTGAGDDRTAGLRGSDIDAGDDDA
jgi:hypothetical protein